MSGQPDQAAANTGRKDEAGAQDQDGGKRQGEQGHVAESGLHTNFAHASPDSNVNPPGKPQSSHGSATEPVPGSESGAESGKAAGNSAAGPSYGQQVVNSSGGAGMDRDS